MSTSSALNEAVVKALPTPNAGSRAYFFADAIVQGSKVPRGFLVRVTATGVRSFAIDYRAKGRQTRYTIGRWPDWSVLQAVREAKELRRRIDRDENPADDRAPPPPAPKVKTVADVLDDFVERYERGRLRSLDDYESAYRRLVKPALGDVPIYELRRSQIVEMLDDVEDNHGPVQADRTLAYFRKALRWYATRGDEFTAPVVPGMARTKATDRARHRILSDDEIRAMWPVCDTLGAFGALVKTLLLSGQRRGDVGGMRRDEIDDDVWTIPRERYKTGREHIVPLSAPALAIIEAQRTGDYVFAQRKGTRLTVYGEPKAKLDRLSGVTGWTLHDLRRTARTLMGKAGVRPDIAERVLGHVIHGVEGVYDRHSYLNEKRDATERLAALIERIVSPPAGSVVGIRDAS